MKNNTFKKFISFEEKEKLFELEYDRFKIWEIARGYIYIEIDMIYNNLQPLFPQKKNKKNINIKTFFSLIKSLKIFFIRKKDYIFLNNPRRVKQKNGLYYCIYTDLLIEILQTNNSCITFEDPYWSLSPNSNVSHFEPLKTHDICYLDIIEYLLKIKKVLFKIFKKNKYKKLCVILQDVKQKFEKEFECDLTNIFKMVEDKILYMVLNYKTLKKIIVKSNPKAVFEFYDIFPSKILINKICKELNIPIIEIQHGIVTEKNPIFLKYGNIDRKYDCIPDYVLSYSEKLLNKKYLPIQKENIFYIGNLFLESKIKEYENVSGLKKNILFISQSNLGKYLSEYASKLADLLENNSDYQIIYKMHPYEIGTEYECLKKKNITVVNNRDKDLYYYQSKSIAQVGVYSTGLYEGLAFGLNTFIMKNCYGFEEFKSIIGQSDSVFYVNDVEEIYNLIINNKLSSVTDDVYWKKVDYCYILKVIDTIIKK